MSFPNAVSVLLCQLLMRNCQKKKSPNKGSSKEENPGPPQKRLSKFISGSRGGPDSLSLQSPLWGPQRKHRLEIFQQLHGDSLMFTCQAGQAYAEFIDTEKNTGFNSNLTIGRCCKGFEVIREKCFLLAIQANL